MHPLLIAAIAAVVVGVVGVVGVVAYLFGAATCFFTRVTFMASYEREMKRSGSHVDAIGVGLRVFSGRPPFDILNDRKIERAAQLLSLIPNPRDIPSTMTEYEACRRRLSQGITACSRKPSLVGRT
jgi:hypothetical protein